MKPTTASFSAAGTSKVIQGRVDVVHERGPVVLADAHAPVRSLHVPARIEQGTASAMTQKVNQELYFASYAVFAPVCPEAPQARVGLEAGHQVIGDRRNRVVTAQPSVQGFCFAHVFC